MLETNELSIEISPQEKVAGEIDLDKFVKIMNESKMKGFQRAIFHSMKVAKNETKWDNGYIANVLAAEMDWNAILTSLEWRGDNEKLVFRMCPITYRNKIEYKKHERTADFRKVSLKEERGDGSDLIVIHSFNPDPEHNIDVWLSKSIFPYINGEWEKTIIDDGNG